MLLHAQQNIPDQFKVSNDPTRLIGWNPTMSIQLILTQLETLFGKQSNALIWNNDKLFQLDVNPNDAPELLFLRVEQCQDVAITAQNPYSDTQLIRNTVHLLLQSGIFLMKEFKNWKTTADKTWTLLKLFIHGMY
jgi:hypothetical protein